jgi:hypothetical protein
VFIILKTREKQTVQKSLEKSLNYEDFVRAMVYADRVTLTHSAYSRSSALRWAFNWEKTDEGFVYWENIHDALWMQDKRDKNLLRLRKTVFVGCMILLLFSLSHLFYIFYYIN